MEDCLYALEPVSLEREREKDCNLRNSSKFTRLRNQSKKRKTNEPETGRASTPLDDAIKLFGKLIEKEGSSPPLTPKKQAYLTTVGELTPPISSQELPTMKRPSLAVQETDCLSPPRELVTKQDAGETTRLGSMTSSAPSLPNKAAVVLRSKLEKMFVPSLVQSSQDKKVDVKANSKTFNMTTVDKIRARRPRMTVGTAAEDSGKTKSFVSGDNRLTLTPRGVAKKETLRGSLKEGSVLKNEVARQLQPPTMNKKTPPAALMKKTNSQRDPLNFASQPAPSKKQRNSRLDTGQKTTRESITDRDNTQSVNATLISGFKVVGMFWAHPDWIEKFRLEVTKVQTSYDTLSSQLKTAHHKPGTDRKTKDFDTRIRRYSSI